MDQPISRAEHEEFAKRMEDEHKRINHRVADLESGVRQIGELTASVEKLAQSVQQMAKSQGRQEERLEELEGRDGCNRHCCRIHIHSNWNVNDGALYFLMQQ